MAELLSSARSLDSSSTAGSTTGRTALRGILHHLRLLDQLSCAVHSCMRTLDRQLSGRGCQVCHSCAALKSLRGCALLGLLLLLCKAKQRCDACAHNCTLQVVYAKLDTDPKMTPPFLVGLLFRTAISPRDPLANDSLWWSITVVQAQQDTNYKQYQ